MMRFQVSLGFSGFLVGFCPFDKAWVWFVIQVLPMCPARQSVVGGKRTIDPCDKIHSEVSEN